MSPQVLLRLIKQHALWFILIPCVTAATVFYFTRKEAKVYRSQATLYTGLASGYSLLSVQQSSFVDRSAIAFDNLLTTLNSKETLRQIGLSLLAQHLELKQPDSLVLAAPGFQKLQEAIPTNVRASLLGSGNADQLYVKLDELSNSPKSNPVKKLLTDPNSYYSVAQIGGKLKATRKNTNDMLDMEYEANDPAVAQQTLNQAIKILGRRYTFFKTSETASVADYYQDKVKKAKQRLDDAEAKLQAFSVQHKVLNFEEDARNVVASRETINGEYNQELMRNRAAKASMDALSRRINQQGGNLLATNSELNNKRNELQEAQSKLINAQAYGHPKTVVNNLQNKVNQLQGEMAVTAKSFTAAGTTPESIPQQTLVNDWLSKVLDYEESTAKLELYKKRLSEYQSKTNEFSPLESQLRQLNRELSVAEKEYLGLVQNLDQAVTQRQNISVDGSLSVLDAPSLSFTPLSSKRWLFVAVGLGVGLFIAIVLTALRFWLDRRVSSPQQAELVIGRPVVAIFPTVKKFSIGSKASRAAVSMFEQLCSAINIEIVQTISKPQPPIITLFSIRSKQGKSWVANGLAHLYAESGQQVAYCYPRLNDNEQKTEKNGITLVPYTVRPDFMNAKSIKHLLESEYEFLPAQYDKIIFELPPLISSPIPVYLINQSYVSLLVTDANSVWARTEKQLLDMYMKVATHPVFTVVNRVGGDYIDAPSLSDAKQNAAQSERILELKNTLPSGAAS